MKEVAVRTILTAALTLGIGGLCVSAAPPGLPTDKPVTLRECVEFALKEHSSVLSAERSVIGAKADLKRANSGYMPKVIAGTDYSSNGSKGVLRDDGTVRDSDSTGTQSTIGISETLYDGGKTRASIQQAKATTRSTIADLELARQDRILAVTVAYFDALRTKRLADIAAQTVAESEEQRKLIQARVDEGDAASVDVYPVDVQMANAKLQKLQADNSAKVAANALRNAVGLDRGTALQLQDVSEPSAEVPVFDECLKCALRDRPELTRSTAQVDSSRAGLTYAKLQTIPVPTVRAGFDRDLGGSSFESQWSLGVGLSLNIFDGGASAAGVEGAKAALESARLRDDQTRKDISTEIEESYLNLTSALERLTASKTNVTLAQTNLEVAREKYRQGLAIPLEIVNAQVSHADAQASNAQALYDSYVARARLDKAMGKRGY